MEGYSIEKPKYCGHRRGDAVVQKKVTFVSIGYTGKGDVVVQRKTERIKH